MSDAKRSADPSQNKMHLCQDELNKLTLKWSRHSSFCSDTEADVSTAAVPITEFRLHIFIFPTMCMHVKLASLALINIFHL